MSWVGRVVNGFRPRYNRDLEDEIGHHLAMRTAEHERAGMNSADAAAKARRMLGSELQIREGMRDMDVSQFIETVLKDLRYAARQMRRSPGFTAVAVLSLALGIGANTAIFTLLDSVLMRKLPVRDPGSLVILSNPGAAGVGVGLDTGARGLMTFSEFDRLRRRLTTFDGLFASESNLPRYDGRINGGGREEIRARLVSGEFFGVLGVAPIRGRFFGPEDDRVPAQSPYAVLSYDYWQKRFAGSPAALGATIRVGRANLTVIGIAGPGFSGESVGDRPEIWAPMTMEPELKPGTDWLHEDMAKNLDKVEWLHVFGRLKPGVSLGQAQAQVDLVFKDMIESDYGALLTGKTRAEFLNQHIRLRMAATGASSVRSRAREPLTILLAMVGLVLLIACANVANLLAARAATRGREVGIRVALGAGRKRLIGQMLTESLMLAALGALGGLVVARVAVRFLIALMSPPTAPLDLNTPFDLRVLAFTCGVAILTAVLFGAAPALSATASDVSANLSGGLRATANRRRVSFAKALVAVQVALSMLLLVGSGLFLRTLENLEKVQLGYQKDHIFQVGVDAEAGGYEGAARIRFFADLQQRLQSIPGVRSVSYSENGLFTGEDSSDEIEVEGYAAKGGEDQEARFDVIGPGYFSSLSVPMLLGREVTADDVAGGRRVVVINESLAKKYFSGRNPVGLHLTAHFGDKKWTWEVIGVAANVRDHRLRGEVPPRYYRTAAGGGYVPDSVSYQVRTAGIPTTVAAAVRRAIHDLNDNVPVVNARPLDQFVDRWTNSERTVAELSFVFGAIALTLACIGIYGVLSFGVARRTSEIGIRMALGARRATVIGIILRETGWMVVAGLAIGLAGAAGATRAIASQLYGVTPLDPATVAAAAVVLMTVAAGASALPAYRASRVNPVTALRTE